jgi:hypothetical protein
MQRANGQEQDCPYSFLHVGREGVLQCATGVRLDACQ